MFLPLVLAGCGQEAVQSPDLDYADNGYGTYFVKGTRIEHPADTSSSIVVDWAHAKAGKAPEDLQLIEEKGIVYSHSTVTDGYEEGQPLDLKMNLMVPADGAETDAADADGTGVETDEPDVMDATGTDEAGAAADGTEAGKDGAALHPVILLVPGGGFITCRIDNKYVEVQRYLAAHGYAVAIMHYHIIGEGRYMDAAADVWAAIDWIREHGPEHGLDPDRIALMGNSAGGYVAALAACEGRQSEPENSGGDASDEAARANSTGSEQNGNAADDTADTDPAGSKQNSDDAIRCVVNFYGLSDLINNKADYEEAAIEAHHKPESSDSQFVNGALSGLSLTDAPEEAEKADPSTYIDGDEPPFLHFHGDADLWVSPSQSVHLHDNLRAAGVETIRYSVIGASHGDKQFRTVDALDITLDFLDKYCRDEK